MYMHTCLKNKSVFMKEAINWIFFTPRLCHFKDTDLKKRKLKNILSICIKLTKGISISLWYFEVISHLSSCAPHELAIRPTQCQKIKHLNFLVCPFIPLVFASTLSVLHGNLLVTKKLSHRTEGLYP